MARFKSPQQNVSLFVLTPGFFLTARRFKRVCLTTNRIVKKGKSNLGHGVYGFGCAGKTLQRSVRRLWLDLHPFKFLVPNPLWNNSSTFKLLRTRWLVDLNDTYQHEAAFKNVELTFEKAEALGLDFVVFKQLMLCNNDVFKLDLPPASYGNNDAIHFNLNILLSNALFFTLVIIFNLQINIISFSPVTPSRRFVRKVSPLKCIKKICSLSFFPKAAWGRNGRILVRHRSSYKARRLPVLHTQRYLFEMPAYATAFIKTPAAKPFVVQIKYPTGALGYLTLPEGLGIGSFFEAFKFKSIFGENYTIGSFGRLYFSKQGSRLIHLASVSFKPYPWARAAGTACVVQYLSFNKDFFSISIPSGKEVKLSINSFGISGRNSNIRHKKEVIGSAGHSRRLGIRPTVRGVAMNPVDHPHGGRTKTSQPEVSPWGWVAKRGY